MTPEELAIEMAKHLPDNEGGITLEDSRFWCKVAETWTDNQLNSFLRLAAALSSPISMLIRQMVLDKVRNEAPLQ